MIKASQSPDCFAVDPHRFQRLQADFAEIGDALGMTSPWVSYGGNAEGAVDFETRDRSGPSDR